MVVKDAVSLQRDLKGLAQEKYAHEVNQWSLAQFSGPTVISSLQDSTLNQQRQWGRRMTPDQLESLLLKISPNFVFENSPNPTKKRLRFLVPGESNSRYLCLYERGPMPEYSIMNGQWRWEPAPDFALGKRTLQRSEVRGTPVSAQEAYDLIQTRGVSGAKDELLRRRADSGSTDPEYRPGFKKVLQEWNEAIRGWRAVLGFVVQSGLVTLGDIKRAVDSVGTDPATERKSWVRIVR